MSPEAEGPKRLAWVTDPHLNFLAPEDVVDFCELVAISVFGCVVVLLVRKN